MSRIRTIVCLLSLAALSGCGPAQAPATLEEEDSSFVAARQSETIQDYKRALVEYQKVIDARKGDAPESHLSAGLIQLNNMKDPVMAIYHFRRFIEIGPGNPKNAKVEEQILAAKRLYLQSLPGQPFAGQTGQMELYDKLKVLRDENDMLKRDVARLEGDLALARKSMANLAPPNATPLTPVAQTPGQGRTPQPGNTAQPGQVAGNVPAKHTIQKGDTLSSISRKYYGSTARWKDIYQANRTRLRSPTELTVGQELVLPQK